MKKIAKENFENNLDHILLENSSNPKTYWKIMKMLIKSNKGSNCIPPLRNSINDANMDDIVYGDEDQCELLNKYFSLTSKLAGRDWKKEELGESSNYYIISKTVAHPLIYSILFPQQSKVRLFIPFEMATILLFHSVDYL